MKPTAIALLAVSLAACTEPIGPDTTGGSGPASDGATSGGGPNDQGFTSGSRLVVRKLTTDDGASQQIGFYDNSLGVNCRMFAVDGQTYRCIPEDVNITAQYFEDAACTKPVAAGCVGSAVLFPLGSASSLCTNPTYEIRPVGAAKTGNPYFLRGTQCVQLDLQDFHELGAPVSLDQYATATESTP